MFPEIPWKQLNILQANWPLFWLQCFQIGTKFFHLAKVLAQRNFQPERTLLNEDESCLFGCLRCLSRFASIPCSDTMDVSCSTSLIAVSVDKCAHLLKPLKKMGAFPNAITFDQLFERLHPPPTQNFKTFVSMKVGGEDSYEVFFLRFYFYIK